MKKFFGVGLVLMAVSACRTPVQLRDAHNYTIDQSSFYDSASAAVLVPYQASLTDSMSTIIGHTETPLMNTRKTGNLGRVMADYTLEYANRYCQENNQAPCDFAVLNNGGIRNSIGVGPISLGHVFEVSPFENKLVIVQLNGRQTAELLEFIAAQEGTPLAGAEIEFRSQAPFLVKAQVQGQAFDSRRSYRVATNDYMALGGDRFTMFLNPESFEETPWMIRDVLLWGLGSETQRFQHVQDRPQLRVYPSHESQN